MGLKVAPVRVGDVEIGGETLSLIAGPCVIETEDATLRAAERLAGIAAKRTIPFIFKSSFDKANRTSLSSYRGPGIAKGLSVLEKVRREIGCPVLSDVHSVEDVRRAAPVLDVLQIPAFLCRQTDLLVAAAETGLPVNVKKGPFLSPAEAGSVVEKLRDAGARAVSLTERGTTFGYNNLVVDMRAIPILRGFGVPVVFDATHSVQQPGGLGGRSGGEREFVPVLARAAVAAGCDALFMEVHEEPDAALCDGPNMLPMDQLSELLEILKNLACRVRDVRDVG